MKIIEQFVEKILTFPPEYVVTLFALYVVMRVTERH
jgi:hypothetical protein